eukprot:gene5659-7815_t
MDFPSAFLIPKIVEDKAVYVLLIPKQLVPFWTDLYPELKPYISARNGSLYVKLKNGYMVVDEREAPKAFYDYLDAYLKTLGFKPTPLDPCFYAKRSKDGISLISVHVDDLLLTTPKHVRTTRRDEYLSTTIKLKFKNITYQHNSIDYYLGMKIVKHHDDGSITINQEGYNIKKLINQYGTSKSIPQTPATVDSHARHDILHATTYLATKSSNPTMHNWRSAIRIVDYLRGNPHAGITIKNPDMKLRIFADASHAIHKDGKVQRIFSPTLEVSVASCDCGKVCLVRKSSANILEVDIISTGRYSLYYLPTSRMLADFLTKPLPQS